MDKAYKKFVLYMEIFLSSNLNKYLFFTFISGLFFLFSFDIGMFWDNILFTSKVGNYLYNNTIFDWHIPDSFDSGHPPTFGFLLAIFWKIFGHKLWVSHLIMVPITIGTLYQIFKFISYYIKSNFIILFGVLLILADPTLSTQLVLVNIELIQIFLFFLAINSILFNKKCIKIIALFFLSIISLRSMMICVGIFLFDVLNLIVINKKKYNSIFNIKFISTYIIGSLPGFIYIVWHFLDKGWIISHADYPWKGHRDFVSINGLIRNFCLLIHKYLDFGKIILFLFLFYCLIKFKKNVLTKETKQLVLLAISAVSIIIVVSLFGTNPFVHRYFIISYIVLNFLSFYLLIKFFKKRKIIYAILFTFLITGNLWIYPRKIAQDWDATLGHIPYHSLRLEAIDYLNEKKINIEEVGSFFPNDTTLDLIDFQGDERSFAQFNGKNKYLFYANVYNLADDELEILDKNYKILKRFDNLNINIIIYLLKEK